MRCRRTSHRRIIFYRNITNINGITVSIRNAIEEYPDYDFLYKFWYLSLINQNFKIDIGALKKADEFIENKSPSSEIYQIVLEYSKAIDYSKPVSNKVLMHKK